MRRLLLACLLTLLFPLAAHANQVNDQEALVVRMVDGDTMEVQLADGGIYRVRYIGIDTPETVALGRPVQCWGADRDCGDFSTWAEVQDFFEAAGGPTSDRHRLDADHEGIACESLPEAPRP
jgi:hypothetical protein